MPPKGVSIRFPPANGLAASDGVATGAIAGLDQRLAARDFLGGDFSLGVRDAFASRERSAQQQSHKGP